MRTSSSRTSRIRCWAAPLAVVAAAVSLVAGSGPAFGLTGAGIGTSDYNFGSPTPKQPLPPCAEFTTMTFEGEYEGTESFTIELHSTTTTWYAGPAGLYSDATCTTPLASIAVEGECNGSDGQPMSGTYSRVGAVAVFNLTGTCGSSTTALRIESVQSCQGAPPSTCEGQDVWEAV